LFLRIIALLTLTLTSPNLSPDTDLERNPISDPVFNVYPDLNCTRRTWTHLTHQTHFTHTRVVVKKV